ncbi:hypothetical protein [Aureliella helgolandensis]|uniref:Uncharacterized protein n=1 Tax=Aureliella helgolandensis TaxID=2527968 RepID=A0A518G0T7_9BACT|nr:hypothetical protein [Aureliella helgolandensis]QDV22211.1 hypothetical protein Q31a_04950 [Aureliella helgolandensis]
MSVAKPQSENTNPVALLLIAATASVGGAVIGASTNAINGAVSPLYFRNIMRWHDVEDIWRASIAQGIFEGLIYGIMFSVVFTLVVGLVSHARCSFRFAARHMFVIAVAIYGCWAVGGLVAMGLATLSPEFYRKAFIGVPDHFNPMLRYAWVGGSIWGAMFGALLAVVIGSVLFAMRWRRLHPQEED